MIYTHRPKAIVLSFLQEAFSQPDFYDGTNDFLWSEDENQSKILIADNYTDDLMVVEQRPAIIISRGPVNWMSIGMNQQEHINMRTQRINYQDLVKTSITCNCFSRNGLQAELIASIVFSTLQYFGEVVKRRGSFEFNSLSIGQEALVQESQGDSVIDLSVVPVQCGIYIYDKWVLRTDEDRADADQHNTTGIRLHTPDFEIDREIKT